MTNSEAAVYGKAGIAGDRKSTAPRCWWTRAYFAHLHDALLLAKRSILILGWDFDGRIKLRPQDDDCPTLGDDAARTGREESRPAYRHPGLERRGLARAELARRPAARRKLAGASAHSPAPRYASSDLCGASSEDRLHRRDARLLRRHGPHGDAMGFDRASRRRSASPRPGRRALRCRCTTFRWRCRAKRRWRSPTSSASDGAARSFRRPQTSRTRRTSLAAGARARFHRHAASRSREPSRAGKQHRADRGNRRADPGYDPRRAHLHLYREPVSHGSRRGEGAGQEARPRPTVRTSSSSSPRSRAAAPSSSSWAATASGCCRRLVRADRYKRLRIYYPAICRGRRRERRSTCMPS